MGAAAYGGGCCVWWDCRGSFSWYASTTGQLYLLTAIAPARRKQLGNKKTARAETSVIEAFLGQPWYETCSKRWPLAKSLLCCSDGDEGHQKTSCNQGALAEGRVKTVLIQDRDMARQEHASGPLDPLMLACGALTLDPTCVVMVVVVGCLLS